MRRLLALLGLLAMVAAPHAELAHGHGHDLGLPHSDCPACQVSSNPTDLAVVPTSAVARLTYHLAQPCAQSRPPTVTAPLQVAPKTSPPRISA